MADAVRSDFLKWIDGGAKALIAVAIPVAGFAIDSSLKTQTEALEKQKAAYQRDVDLTLKFYDIIASKSFECFDESKGPLLRFFIETNNHYNESKIEYADIYGSLIKHTIANKDCKIGKEGEVTEVNAETPAQREGWVLLGRNHTSANFEVVSDGAKHGSISPNAIIRATTSVYLRSNNSDIVLSKNEVVAVLSEGTCATVRQTAQLRGHTWAQIAAPTLCPAETKRTAARM
jgi:hypothetical protein